MLAKTTAVFALALCAPSIAAADCNTGGASKSDGVSICRGGKLVKCATDNWQPQVGGDCVNKPFLVVFR